MSKAESPLLSVVYLTEVVRSPVLGAATKLFDNQFQEILGVGRTGLRINPQPGADHICNARRALPADFRRNIEPARQKSFNQFQLRDAQTASLIHGKFALLSRSVKKEVGLLGLFVVDYDCAGNKISQAPVPGIQKHGDDSHAVKGG